MTLDLRFLKHLAELGRTDLHPGGATASAEALRALALGPGLRVLELGCGTGRTLIRTALRADSAIHGIDILSEMLAVAQRIVRTAGLRRRISLAQADLMRLPVRDGVYDRVYAESVLGFQPASVAEICLREVSRSLKPGGRFVAVEAVWMRNVPVEAASKICRASLRDFGLCQANDLAWSVDEWVALMRRVGFQVRAADRVEREPTRPGSWLRGGTRLPAVEPLVPVLVSTLYGMRGYVVPRLAKQRARYRRLLKAHREDHKYVETRIFVLDQS